MLPYPSWKHARAARLTPSTNQQHAWLRLMVAALETNFFFYESVARAARRFCSRVASRNNHFQALLTASRRIYSSSNLQGAAHAHDAYSGTTQNSLANMVLPSISEAFRGGDGTSLTNVPRYDGDGLSIGGVGDMHYHSGTFAHGTSRPTARSTVGGLTRSVF